METEIYDSLKDKLDVSIIQKIIENKNFLDSKKYEIIDINV